MVAVSIREVRKVWVEEHALVGMAVQNIVESEFEFISLRVDRGANTVPVCSSYSRILVWPGLKNEGFNLKYLVETASGHDL